MTNANTPPVIRSSHFAQVKEDQPANGRIAARDADGDTLIYAVKDGAEPSKGSVAIAANGTFTYTPDANANGSETFTLTVSDGHSGSAEQVFTFDIQSVNDTPVAGDDTGFTVQTGQTLRISASALLANDADADGDALEILSVAKVGGGTVRIDANGDILFTAKNNFSGDASFSYRVSDGLGGKDVAIAHIDVTPVPQHVLSAGLLSNLLTTLSDDAGDVFRFVDSGGKNSLTARTAMSTVQTLSDNADGSASHLLAQTSELASADATDPAHYGFGSLLPEVHVMTPDLAHW